MNWEKVRIEKLRDKSRPDALSKKMVHTRIKVDRRTAAIGELHKLLSAMRDKEVKFPIDDFMFNFVEKEYPMSIKQHEYLIGVAKRNKIKYNELKLKDRVKKFAQSK